ncbi:DUF6879 family protein [Streptomyces xiamenensis]|uniref:DUF6879 family protein n=1 Tax=Streptomyces xiamenensis TaxID=408015 RepID=UPI0036EA5274
MAPLTTEFNSFSREAFRLETLDTYSIPRSERYLQAFLAGEPQPEDFAVNPWMATVRNATESGKRMYRVHIVRRPLTDYLRYELGWGYHRNAQAGEEFFILDTTERKNPLTGVPDFWMFDEKTVAVMHYDASHAFVGAETLPVERADDFVGHRDLAMAHAEPFFSWWRRHGDT